MRWRRLPLRSIEWALLAIAIACGPPHRHDAAPIRTEVRAITGGYDDWNGPYVRVTVHFWNESTRSVNVNRYRVAWPEILLGPSGASVGKDVDDAHLRLAPGAAASRTVTVPHGGVDPSLLTESSARIDVLDWQ
jgi:hypothetical protein